MRKAAAIILTLVLSACAVLLPSKREIAQRSAGVATKQQLLAALGGPDDALRMGPVEEWVYKARDGEVLFIIADDQVTLQVNDELLKFDP